MSVLRRQGFFLIDHPLVCPLRAPAGGILDFTNFALKRGWLYDVHKYFIEFLSEKHKMHSANNKINLKYQMSGLLKTMETKSKRYYAVLSGHKTGIFDTWFGAGGAKAQIDGFSNAKYKGFGSYDEAKNWLNQPKSKGTRIDSKASAPINATSEPGLKEIVFYTDGGCLNNPGPGGYGTVMIFKGRRKELSGGYRKTTNNRMELMACIVGLSELKTRCRVLLHSDSKYVINGIEKGWAKKWRRLGWMRNKVDPAENYDLWKVLLDLCDKHQVSFNWVKGHSGVPENERCDELAGEESSKKGLPQDVAYEGGKTTIL